MFTFDISWKKGLDLQT